MATPNDTIDQPDFRRLRLLRRLLFWIITSFLPVMILLAFLPIPERISLMIGGVWITAGIVIELFIGFARCPACGKYFHVGRGSGNIFARYCVNCGVALWPQRDSGQ